MNGSIKHPVVTILGCGRLGSAILQGLITKINAATDIDAGLPSRLIACVRTAESEKVLRAKFQSPGEQKDNFYNVSVAVSHGENVLAAEKATMIILACQPSQVRAMLDEEGMRAAVDGKLVLSICAGITEEAIREMLYRQCGNESENCYVVHAMPNAASMVGQSATVICDPISSRPLPAEYEKLVVWTLEAIGTIVQVPGELMNAASITAGSTPGFLGPMLLGLAQGATDEGLDEHLALRTVAQAMKGTAEMILALGERPNSLMDKVATPGGCTERGLRILLDSERKSSVPDAFRTAIAAGTARAYEIGSE